MINTPALSHIKKYIRISKANCYFKEVAIINRRDFTYDIVVCMVQTQFLWCLKLIFTGRYCILLTEKWGSVESCYLCKRH